MVLLVFLKATVNHASEMLQAWGTTLQGRKKRDQKSQDKLAVFSPLIYPTDIPIPAQMKGKYELQLKTISSDLVLSCMFSASDLVSCG